MIDKDYIQVHMTKPIADGIVFDDLFGIPIEMHDRIIPRGVVFLTEFRANDVTYGGRIIARSWEAAEEIAFGRGLGEKVIGTLEAVVMVKP